MEIEYPESICQGTITLNEQISSSGHVFRATHSKSNEVLIVKAEPQAEYINRSLAFDPRWRGEGILDLLIHSKIPNRLGETVENGVVYIVYEYIPGSTLAEILSERCAPLSEEVIIDYGIQLCDILTYLHMHEPRVVHRDIKPSNIILHDEEIFLIDFGIAVIPEKIGVIADKIGTKGYAPPEQINEPERIDGRTDIYALGVTLFQLATKERVIGRAEKMMRKENSNLSLGFMYIVDRCTKKRMEDRYQTCEELKNDLLHCRSLTSAIRFCEKHEKGVSNLLKVFRMAGGRTRAYPTPVRDPRRISSSRAWFSQIEADRLKRWEKYRDEMMAKELGQRAEGEDMSRYDDPTSVF